MTPRRAALGIVVVAGGLLASVGAFWAVRQAERSKVETEFVQLAQNAGHFVSEELHRQQDSLHALRTIFHFSENVDRHEFAGAAQDLMSRQKGVRTFEWVERVPGQNRAATVAALRAEGFADFEFNRRVSGNTLERMPERPEYFPVMFIEPIAGNERALGFDLGSGTTWPLLEKIAGANELALSGRLPLLTNGAATDWGYIMALPVYTLPIPPTPEERRACLRGFLFGIFHIARTLESFFEGTLENEDVLEILFLDRSAKPGARFLHFHSRGAKTTEAGVPAINDFERGLHLRVPMSYAGRQWELWIRPRADWLAGHSHMRSWLTLALGLVITGAAGNYAWLALRRERVVNRLVAKRTAELRAVQAALERDIRERRETERQLGNVISQLPGAAFRCLFDEKLTAVFASDGMFQITGFAADDFTSGRMHMGELILPQDRAAVRAVVTAAVEERRAFESEHRIRDRDGTVRWLLVRGRPIYADDGSMRFIEGLAIDISALKTAEDEKRAFERKLLEAQKLESLGVLAGGIAHDFNNLLTAMLGNASLARYAMPPGSAGAEHLQNIEEAARRAADLCQQMLAYAGKKELHAKPLDLSELVRSTAALLRVSIPRNTRFELRLDESLPAVLADPAQCHQIVMNLVINAADAIGEQPGEITLTTFQREADREYLRTALHQPDLPSGTYVGLEVRDTGCGMEPETLARIFEPFFTTKFSGRGLGLAAVVGIVQSHRGALFVESAVGRGSIFRLLLQAHQTASPSATSRALQGMARLRGTVLVVDDEEPVRVVLGTLLQRVGMTPILAASGTEALRLCAEQPNKVDLVMLDLIMPGLSGEDTLRMLRERHGPQRVIVMSGYSDQESIDRCVALGAEFLAKPFELPALLERLQALGGLN